MHSRRAVTSDSFRRMLPDLVWLPPLLHGDDSKSGPLDSQICHDGFCRTEAFAQDRVRTDAEPATNKRPNPTAVTRSGGFDYQPPGPQDHAIQLVDDSVLDLGSQHAADRA